MNLKTLAVLTLCACGGPAPLELQMSFDVGPGAQGLKCQTFANPTGQDVDIGVWTTTLSNAGHHVLVFLVDDAKDSAAEDCEPTLPGQLIFQSQTTGETAIAYPRGVAARLGATQGLMVRVHYLNDLQTQAAKIDNHLTLTLVASGSVRDRVRPMMLDNTDLLIPAQVPSFSIEKTCTLGHDLELVTAVGHIHSHGLEVRASSAAAGELYDTINWHQPEMRVFDPPLPLKAGDSITFSCTYRGAADRDIHFGDRIEYDEMCSVVGSYLARDPADPGFLGCTPPQGSTGCLPCFGALTMGRPQDACVDSGSAGKLAALQACTCGTGPCASACAATACKSGGGRPDAACEQCQRTSCDAQAQACISDQ